MNEANVHNSDHQSSRRDPNKAVCGGTPRIEGERDLSVLIQSPLFILCKDFGRGPIKVVLPEHAVLDPRLLLTHPVSCSTSGPPENLYVLLVRLVRPRLLAIRVVDADIFWRSIKVCELELALDRLCLSRGPQLGKIPQG